ncbi:hypothetical protein HN682_03485, partial [Candidatus Peregrinibacteria bacterium]|nr:hypothetical protein [Candidatus Peregrinibacteria bacterium]
IANNTSIDEFDDDDVDSQEDEVIDEAAIKEQISSILDNASTSCDTSPPKEAPAELTESKPLSIAERREIYEKTGMDPCSIFVEPRVLRVFGGSPEVKLELTLPLISKDSEGKDFEPQYMEVLQRTLDFINHINVFGKYHPSTLPQLAQFLKGPNDPGSFPG